MLGLVTIGQSPRVDVLHDLAPLLAGRAWTEHGALDALDVAGVAALAPRPGEAPLVSRMRDGASVRLSHAAIVPLLEQAVAACVADGAAAILVMCSGHLPHLRAEVPVHPAEPLAHAVLETSLGSGLLGIISPHDDQIDDATRRWSGALGAPAIGAAADPYAAPFDEIVAAGERLAREGAEAIVLDCFGYGRDAAEAIQASTGVPTHAVRMVAAEAALRMTEP